MIFSNYEISEGKKPSNSNTKLEKCENLLFLGLEIV